MVFIIVLKLNSDRRYKTTDARMMSLHTQKGHGFDGWVTGDTVKGVESLWGDKEPQTWSCNGSSGFSPAAHYTLGRWFVGFNSQKTKKEADFKKERFLHFSTKPSVLVTAVFVSTQNNSLFTTHVSQNNLSSICQRGRCYLLVCL